MRKGHEQAEIRRRPVRPYQPGGQNPTLGTRCEARLIPHSGGFERVALAASCAPKSDNLWRALSAVYAIIRLISHIIRGLC